MKLTIEQWLQLGVLLVAGTGAHFSQREQLTRVEGKLNTLTFALVEKGVIKSLPVRGGNSASGSNLYAPFRGSLKARGLANGGFGAEAPARNLLALGEPRAAYSGFVPTFTVAEPHGFAALDAGELANRQAPECAAP